MYLVSKQINFPAAVLIPEGMFTQAVFFSGAGGCFTLYSYDTGCFCKNILGAFKNTAASGFFSLLWVVFKLG
jgi:hypothetical protein